jgi:hypothetical protein
MSDRLWFPLNDVLALAEHAARSGRHRTSPQQRDAEILPAPALVFLIDRGIAFTSSGQPPHSSPSWTSIAVFADGFGPGTGSRHRRGAAIGADDRALYLPLAEPGHAGRTLLEDRRADAANGARWFVLDSDADHVTFGTHFTREDRPAPTATWIPARVEIPDLLGPYQAQIADGRTWNGWAIPRFTAETAARIATDTQTLAARHAPDEIQIVRLRVEIVSHAGTPQEEVETITADPDGLFPIGAFAWTWEVRHGDPPTPAGAAAPAAPAPDPGDRVDQTACLCPECNACGQGLGAQHDLGCPWQEGTRAHETPTIAAQATVLPEHTHRPGCPRVQRSPGPLFTALNDNDEQCLYCGAVNTCDGDTIASHGGTTEHHQRCTACGQTWSYLDISAVL